MSQRLGQNLGGYHGETIQLHSVLRDVRAAAERHGWRIENILADATRKIIALHRPATNPSRRIYISAGIHGDEPAGPLALRQLLDENLWPEDADLWLCPCLNPTGFPLNRRENREGKDLNRDYRHLETAEVRAHIDWLKRQPSFDLTLCLHEDWESHGFYLYELNPDRQASPARAMLAAAAAVCPIDHSPEIEGRPANAGLINPNLDPNSRPQWPEAFFLLQNKTRLSYTLEAPSDFPLPVRVASLVAATRAALSVTGSP